MWPIDLPPDPDDPMRAECWRVLDWIIGCAVVLIMSGCALWWIA